MGKESSIRNATEVESEKAGAKESDSVWQSFSAWCSSVLANLKHRVKNSAVLIDLDQAAATNTRTMAMLSGVLSWAILLALVGYWYNRQKKIPVGSEGHVPLPTDAFSVGLFSCLDDYKLSCLACWCGPVRWADTMRMAGFLSFFSALAMFIGLSVLSSLGSLKLSKLSSVVASVAGIVLLVTLTHYRQKLREKFGLPNGTCGSVFQDCITYACCSCCAIVQEARQVELAYLTKHPAVESPPAVQSMV